MGVVLGDRPHRITRAFASFSFGLAIIQSLMTELIFENLELSRRKKKKNNINISLGRSSTVNLRSYHHHVTALTKFLTLLFNLQGHSPTRIHLIKPSLH